MREITAETAAAYLRETGRVPPGAGVEARALGWGVSNVVLRVAVEGRPPIVLKQSREQLRTAARWVSRLDRIWTEVAALRLLAEVLPPGTVPRVLFEDREDYLFAMTSAPDGAAVWKEQLLAGAVDPEVARRAGAVLGAMHAETAGHPALSGPLADREVFDQLRLDPFYRTAARAHPELAPRLEALVASALDPVEHTFVHGDFSPKNLLVHPDGRGLTAVDFETAHAGDPAFDLGFFVSHLLLKAFRVAADPGRRDPLMDAVRAALETYAEAAREVPGDRLRRAATHAAACTLARVDGKSPVDYLDAAGRAAARRFAVGALRREAPDLAALIARAAREMR